MKIPRIVLASSSEYRRELLARLRLPFIVEAPDVAEDEHPGEAPAATALRLARTKALAVAAWHPQALVIGSDQVADVAGDALSKPGHHDAALAQLQRMQGQTIVFHTALALVDGRDGTLQVDSIPTLVRFRNLGAEQLDAYLRLERPYDCAGAAKIESLGITLVESVQSDDPTALIGLPLIRLTSMLTACGLALPAA